MFTDIHSHIIPAVDDGPDDMKSALELVTAAVNDGTDRLIATPHFYALDHSLEERTAYVEQQFRLLKGKIEEEKIGIKELSLGYEVRFFNGISKSEHLEKLCLKNTRNILIELSYDDITDKIADEIRELSYNGYNVILAHIERYHKFDGYRKIKTLIEEEAAVAHINASSVLSGGYQRTALRLLREGLVFTVASDMHSVDKRPPKLTRAYKVIEKKFGANLKYKLIFNAQSILQYPD